MKRYLLILIVIGLSLAGCSQGGFSPGPKDPAGPQEGLDVSPSDLSEDAIVIEKSGVLVTKEYAFADFSQLEVGLFDVDVRQDESYSVTLEMDENVLEHVQVTKESETLRIGLDPAEAYRMENIRMRAEITMPNLTRLIMSLVDDGEVTGFISEDDMVIDLSKSSVRGDIFAGNLEITAEVGSTVKLSGSAGDITIKATVDSDVDLSELKCHDAMVTAEVSSLVTVYPTGRLDAEASSSKVWYVGDPILGEIRTRLDGSVEKK